MSTLRYSAMTSVIVRVADSVTESSSGKFIMETPQTSGTGLLPPPSSLQASGRQTSDKQLFVPGHVLPSSPLLFSPLRAHLCYWAALLAAGRPCALIVVSVQMRSDRGVSAGGL